MQQRDYNYGIQKENEICDVLGKYLNVYWSQSKDRYDLLDRHDWDKKIHLEIKSRRVRMNQYNSTMVGMNKINYARLLYEAGHTIYFVFVFTDGAYYWKFNNNGVDFYTAMGGRGDRGATERKLYAYIPISNLLPISLLDF